MTNSTADSESQGNRRQLSLVELQSLAEFCNCGASLKAILQDQLVCGIEDSAIQHHLLAEVPLSFDKALKLAKRMETAAQNVKELKVGAALTPSKEVYKVTPPQYKGKHGKVTRQTTRFRCSKSVHLASKCKVKGTQCYHCGKSGHLQAVCVKAKGTAKKPGPPHPVQHVQEHETEEYLLF